MFDSLQQWSSQRRWLTGIAAIVLVGLFAWGTLHPDHRPDASWISSATREDLGKTGFTAIQGIHSAAFEIVESSNGHSTTWNTRQRLLARDPLLTERWVDRRTNGFRQQVSGLYIGPLAVVRHRRQWLPIFGDLLPYHFWQSSHMTSFSIEKLENFPSRTGGVLIARISYEDRHATGEIARTEWIRLRCDVRDVIQASSIAPGLTGTAAKLACTEVVEEIMALARKDQTRSSAQTSDSYTHWYVLDRSWSIPIEGEYTIEIPGLRSLSMWKARLVAFD